MGFDILRFYLKKDGNILTINEHVEFIIRTGTFIQSPIRYISKTNTTAIYMGYNSKFVFLEQSKELNDIWYRTIPSWKCEMTATKLLVSTGCFRATFMNSEQKIGSPGENVNDRRNFRINPGKYYSVCVGPFIAHGTYGENIATYS